MKSLIKKKARAQMSPVFVLYRFDKSAEVHLRGNKAASRAMALRYVEGWNH